MGNSSSTDNKFKQEIDNRLKQLMNSVHKKHDTLLYHGVWGCGLHNNDRRCSSHLSYFKSSRTEDLLH